MLGLGEEGGPVVELALTDDNDGYVSPEFDLPSESENEAPRAKGANGLLESLPPNKRRKVDVDEDIDEEELALRLLRQRR